MFFKITCLKEVHPERFINRVIINHLRNYILALLHWVHFTDKIAFLDVSYLLKIKETTRALSEGSL